ANHTDCLVSALHHCFDGPTGELAHAFFPPHGGIHFDDSEYWVLGPTRYSWKKEFPFPTVAATAPPPRTKTRLVSEGRNVTFRCGQKILHKKGKVHWYKDQEPLESSYPGYLALGEAHLSIIANAINEGTYTCVVRRRQRVLTTYSWRVRVRP
ncbi:PREDICTED: matrix metalloproteinase-23, partial [Myotis brandtii]|uniref:matrix metalloproteinase-23 n=1 Tax=Myotis brandtii TaxID=109478 RepID=UPI0007043CFB